MCLAMQSAVGPAFPHTQLNALAEAFEASLLLSLPLWDEMRQLLRRHRWLAATFVEKAVPAGCSSFECQSRLWPGITRTDTYCYLQNSSEGSMCHCGSKQKVLPHPNAGEDIQRNLCMTNLSPRSSIKTLCKDCTEQHG